MGNDQTMNLYLIQDPDNLPHMPHDKDNEDDPRDYDENLLKYFKSSVPVRDIWDFVFRISFEVAREKRLIKKLIIGSHGGYEPAGSSGVGFFYIGKSYISAGLGSAGEREVLKRVAQFFVKDADVYILACRTGNDKDVLQAVSKALGGIRVHGFTNYITTTDYGPLGIITLEDGTEDGGKHIVCVPGGCREAAP